MKWRGGAELPTGWGARESATPLPVVRSSACSGCMANDHEMHHQDGMFWIVCPVCTKVGPQAASPYEALIGRRRLAGLPALGMSLQLIWICAILLACAVIVGKIGSILGFMFP